MECYGHILDVISSSTVTSTSADEANVKSEFKQVTTSMRTTQKPLYNPSLGQQSLPTAVEAKKATSTFSHALREQGHGLHPTPGQWERRQGVQGWRDLLKIMRP